MKKLKSSKKETGWKKLSGMNETFQFKEGVPLTGKLIEKKAEAGKYQNGIFTIEQDGTKKVFSVWESSGLQSLQTVKIGSSLKIIFNGIVKSKKGRKVKSFDVWVK